MPSANPATPTGPNSPPQLPDGIEVFRAGRHIDDNGVAHDFSQADINGMAAAYDPTLREAPLTVGHPTHDLPAYGWAAGFSVAGDRLLLAPRDAEPQFAEMVRTRRFPKRSLALYAPTHPSNPKPGQWYPRHVAFLGAQPPAIAGLKDIQFADSADGLVCFSEATPADHTTPKDDTMSKELQDQAAAEKARADKATADLAAANTARQAAEDKLAGFAAAARSARHAEHVHFAEAAMGKGKLKKPDVAALVAVLDSVADAPVQFSEGGEDKTVSPVALIKALVDRAEPLVQFGEHATGNLTGQAGNGGHAARTDAELDAEAKNYAAKHNVQYAEALRRVVSFTGAA